MKYSSVVILRPLKVILRVPTLLSVLFFFLTIISCSDNEEGLNGATNTGDLGFFPLGEIRTIFDHEMGEIWIYEDQISGALDTMILSFIQFDTVSVWDHKRNFSYETVNFIFENVHEPYSYEYFFDGHSAGVHHWEYFFMLNRKFRENGFYSGHSPCFISPCTTDSLYTNPLDHAQKSGCTFLKTKYGSYDNVLYFNSQSDATFKSRGHAQYFWSPGDGLVRFNLQVNGEVLEDWVMKERIRA